MGKKRESSSDTKWGLTREPQRPHPRKIYRLTRAHKQKGKKKKKSAHTHISEREMCALKQIPSQKIKAT